MPHWHTTTMPTQPGVSHVSVATGASEAWDDRLDKRSGAFLLWWLQGQAFPLYREYHSMEEPPESAQCCTVQCGSFKTSCCWQGREGSGANISQTRFSFLVWLQYLGLLC